MPPATRGIGGSEVPTSKAGQEPLLFGGGEGRGFGAAFDFEGEFVAVFDHVQFLSGLEGAAEDFLGDGVFEIPLDGAAHGAGSVLRIVTFGDEELFGVVFEHDGDVFGLEAVDDFFHFKVDDVLEVALLQAVEDDDVIQAIEELRFEDALGFFHHFAAHALVTFVEFGCAEAE